MANTGAWDSDEVIQVYAHVRVASVTQPVQQLVVFSRVSVDRGASVRVSFKVPAAALAFTGRGGGFVVEPGSVDVYVGGSSSSLPVAGVTIVLGEGAQPALRNGRFGFDVTLQTL